ncbi:MAG TPA: hypothetical protein HPP66_07855 [Planctomycetes bacterium]|nr:hypothetical protein [Planctomycetota bacterium]
MKTSKTIVILLALVLLTATGAQSAEKPAKKEISNTRTASCLVKITTDPIVLSLNEIAIEYLVSSTGVAGKAAREILDISPDIAHQLFEIKEIYSVFPDSAGFGIPTTTSGVPAFPTTATSRYTSARRTPTTRPATRSTTRTARPTTPTRTPIPRTPTVTQPLRSTTEQTILFRLYVDLNKAEVITAKTIKSAAEEFMIALIANLRSALRGAFDEYRTKFNQQLDLASLEAARAESDLVQMQVELRKISDSRDLSRQSILSDVSSLRQKRQSAMMQMASDEALIEATISRITKEQNRRKELVENDPIAKEFKSIIDVHERRLKDTQKLYEAGRVPAADIQDIREKIIKARIELARRQEEVSNPPGSIVLSSLNDEVADLSIKVTIAQQEIGSLIDQLGEADGLLAKADRYELLSLKADIAKQSLEEALLWHARLGRNIRSIQPPDVTVIGAE